MESLKGLFMCIFDVVRVKRLFTLVLISVFSRPFPLTLTIVSVDWPLCHTPFSYCKALPETLGILFNTLPAEVSHCIPIAHADAACSESHDILLKCGCVKKAFIATIRALSCY